MEKIWIDQLGNTVKIPFPPTRIISLVPSQTELLFDLGLDDQIVGVTKFCVHPADQVKSKTKIGGTKKFNLDRIRALKPDLIIGNKEENYPEGISILQKEFPVWMSDIISLPDAYAMMLDIARLADREVLGTQLVEEIKSKFNTIIPDPNSNRVAYLIWKNPLMVAGEGTFIHEMLKVCGWINVFADQKRYPEVTMEEIVALAPDLIFLSSEPYPFSKKHVAEFKSALPGSKVMLVDGEFFSWYGSRLLKAPGYFKSLFQLLNYP
jgi:ABC-type Fe3+-hydroxamate transport system substrate-binding protein